MRRGARHPFNARTPSALTTGNTLTLRKGHPAPPHELAVDAVRRPDLFSHHTNRPRHTKSHPLARPSHSGTPSRPPLGAVPGCMCCAGAAEDKALDQRIVKGDLEYVELVT